MKAAMNYLCIPHKQLTQRRFVLYGNVVVKDDYLCIPHKQLTQRRFVLEPLSEIIPDYVHPVLNLSVRQLLNDCADTLKVERIA